MEIGNNTHSHNYPAAVNKNRVQPTAEVSARAARLTVANGKARAAEYISRGEVVRGQRANRTRNSRQVRPLLTAHSAGDGITFQGQRALDAYHDHGAHLSHGGAEVMPRVDNYV